jgi:hypothetical protein
MHRAGMFLGLLLSAFGLVAAAALIFGPVGDAATFPPAGASYWRAPLAAAAGLALAAGLTLVGLNAGHWRHPVSPGHDLDNTPDRQTQDPTR